MTRRRFLSWLGAGAVALAIPAPIIRAAGLLEPARFAALDYLRRALAEQYALLSRFSWPTYVSAMYVSRWLFELAEGEMICRHRYVAKQDLDFDHVLFKGIPLAPDRELRGKTIRFVCGGSMMTMHYSPEDVQAMMRRP